MNNDLQKKYQENEESVIVFHPKLQNDLEKIFKNSGKNDVFSQKFLFRLNFLKEKMEACIVDRKAFEICNNTNGKIFSMRIIFTMNIRILFFFSEKNNKKVILLNAFHENNNDKRRSDGSYDKAIKIAESRMKELEEI